MRFVTAGQRAWNLLEALLRHVVGEGVTVGGCWCSPAAHVSCLARPSWCSRLDPSSASQGAAGQELSHHAVVHLVRAR